MFQWITNRFFPDDVPTVDTGSLSTKDTQLAARQAIEHAEKGYQNAVANETRVSDLAQKLHIQKEKNNFAALIEHTMKGAG